MSKAKKLLSDIVGKDGYEVLEKAIFKRGTQAVVDPLEFYLPLIVAPRSILSWLVQNIKPLNIGEHKDFPFPGRDDIRLYVQKDDIDQYRAEFRQGGKVIHSFDKQSLPAMSAHLMTVGEMYDSFTEESKEKEHPAKEQIKEKLHELKETPEEEAKEHSTDNSSMDVVRSIMSLNEVQLVSSDPEHAKWAISHANVKELTGVIGKLVDALVAKKVTKEKIDEDLDKMAIKEQKGDESKVETSITPQEKDKADRKAAGRPKDDDAEWKENALAHIDTAKDTYKERTDKAPVAPKCTVVPAEASGGKITKEEMPVKKRSVREVLMKPYASDAQRRWAHTATGTKELGGKEKVKEWDKESKGKDLPEKVGKFEAGAPPMGGDSGGPSTDPGPGAQNAGAPPMEDKDSVPVIFSRQSNRAKLRSLKPKEKKVNYSKAEMPSGAGMPKKPAMPQMPKPPVPAGKNPAGAAAKQAQASARGGVSMPKTPGAPMPHNPSIKPKMAQAPKPAGMGKSEKSYILSEKEVYTPCTDCGKPEFIKSEDGTPKFNPCACFSVVRKDEEGRPLKFLSMLKKNDGTFALNFSPEADSDSVKAFLLTLKASLIMKKKFGNSI